MCFLGRMTQKFHKPQSSESAQVMASCATYRPLPEARCKNCIETAKLSASSLNVLLPNIRSCLCLGQREKLTALPSSSSQPRKSERCCAKGQALRILPLGCKPDGSQQTLSTVYGHGLGYLVADLSSNKVVTCKRGSAKCPKP